MVSRPAIKRFPNPSQSHRSNLPLAEEMFSSGQGFWWSPNGKYLAYIESNDTQVHHIEYTWFGDEQYPGTASIPYPKVRHPLTRNSADDARTELCSLCVILTIGFLSTSSQELPTPKSKCLLWTPITPPTSLRLTCQPCFRTRKSILQSRQC